MMKEGKKLSFFLLLCLSSCILCQDLYVSIGGNGDCMTPQTACGSLKDALNQINGEMNGTIVYIDSGIYSGDDNIGLPLPDTPISIVGQGEDPIIFDSQGSLTTCFFLNGDFSISNVILSNSSTSGILNFNPTNVTLNNVGFKDMKNSVYLTGVTLIMEDVRLDNNIGTAIVLHSCTNVTINNVTVENSSSSESLVQIIDSEDFYIIDSLFNGNVLAGDSSIVELNGSYGNIKGCTFFNNYCEGVTGCSITVSDSQSLIQDAEIQITETSFTNSTSQYGSVFYTKESSAIDLSYTFQNCNIDDNVAFGSGILFFETCSQATITATSFKRNFAGASVIVACSSDNGCAKEVYFDGDCSFDGNNQANGVQNSGLCSYATFENPSPSVTPSPTTSLISTSGTPSPTISITSRATSSTTSTATPDLIDIPRSMWGVWGPIVVFVSIPLALFILVLFALVLEYFHKKRSL